MEIKKDSCEPHLQWKISGGNKTAGFKSIERRLFLKKKKLQLEKNYRVSGNAKAQV